MNIHLNSQTSPTKPHLVEDEILLFVFLDGQASPEQAAQVRAHLAACAECRQLQLRWQQLEAQLATGLQRPALSADFATRLHAKIQSKPLSNLPNLDLHQKRARLEAEWQRLCAIHRKSFVRSALPALLDFMGYAVALVVGGYVLFCLLNRFLRTWVTAPAEPQFLLPVACGLGLLTLLVAFSFATKNRFWRWLADS